MGRVRDKRGIIPAKSKVREKEHEAHVMPEKGAGHWSGAVLKVQCCRRATVHLEGHCLPRNASAAPKIRPVFKRFARNTGILNVTRIGVDF